MSDIEGRAADYEQRLAGAGTTDDLMGGLAESVKRNQRTTRWLVIIVCLGLLLSVGFGGLAYVAQQSASRSVVNANRGIANANKIAAIVQRQQQDRYDVCRADVEVVWERNLAFDKLIEVEKETLYKTDIERNLGLRRISALKEALILPVPDCKRLKP